MFTGLGSLINEPRADPNCCAKKGCIAVRQKQSVFRTLRYQKLSGQKRPFLAQVGKCDNPTRILTVGGHRVNTNLINDNWDDLLRLAGSLKLGVVQATSIMRTLRMDDRPTKLAQAVAELGPH